MNMVASFQAIRWSRGLYILLLALGLSPVVSVAYAQELLSELAGPAAKHKASNEALDKQKQESVASATKSYLSALDGIEKSATAKGELDLVAAVVKEREAAVAGALDPELPTALPKAKLQSTRKTLLAKIEQLNVDFAKRKKLVDADYLRFLATLQTKAASNPELAKQLAAEKAALLAGSTDNGSGGATARVAHGKNIIVNGDFEKVADGKAEGWLYGDLVTVEKENKNSFIRLKTVPINKDGSVATEYVFQSIFLPADVKTVTLSARCRATIAPSAKGKPAAFVIFYDKNGKEIHFVYGNLPEYKGFWKTIEQIGLIPKDAVRAGMALTNDKCSGQIDFDDVEVTFK
ncbi:MAG: hypothetical protein WCJ02_08205 [bacterium]